MSGGRSVAGKTPARLAGLQQLRFVAAFLVLVHHTLEECAVRAELPVARWLVLLGACGVDIFFVISGFVIWRTTAGFARDTSAIDFMRKRLWRVMPLYWLVLGLIVVLATAGLAFRGQALTPARLVQSFLLLPPFGGRGPILGVAWTLVYEMYFYALCAMALCVPHVPSRPLALAAMLAFVPVLLAAVGAAEAGAHYGNPIVLEFVFGCLIARRAGSTGRTAGLRWLAVAGVAGTIAAARLLAGDHTDGLDDGVRWWGWGLPAAAMVCACAAGLRVPEGRAGRSLVLLGDASYALYLTHGFVMIGLARWLEFGAVHDAGTALLLGAVAVPVAVGLSLVVHVRIERPLMRRLAPA